MNFQSDSDAKRNSGLLCPTPRLETGPQLRTNIRPICPPGGQGALGEHSPMTPVTSPGEETAQKAGEKAKNFLKRLEEARVKLAIARGSKKANLCLGWLARDPSEWIGRKIRHPLNGKGFV